MIFSRISRRSSFLLFTVLILAASLLLTSCLSSGESGLETLFTILDSPAGDAIIEGAAAIADAAEEITPENEYYIGRSVAAAITTQYPIVRDAPEMTAYLNAICGAITMNSEMPFLYKGYSAAILDTDEINAMATPGGHIFISRGLINSVRSEDALAAVIAHEIAHIQLKHSIKAIKTSRITGAVAQSAKATAMAGVVIANEKFEDKNGFGLSEEEMEQVLEATASFSDITNEIAEKLVNSGFSKSQEFDADEKALTLMADAGYNPEAMVEMLSMIPSGGNHGWDATHPKPEERIKKVQKALREIDMPNIRPSAVSIRAARFEANRL